MAASGGGGSAVSFIAGTTTTKLLWPESSIPSTFTICSVTRYTGGTRRRILTCLGSPSQAANWLHGHLISMRGVAYYANGLQTSYANHGVLDDWLVMCGTNAGATAPGNIILDQDEIGTADGGVGSCRLNIGYFQPSDWALHSVLIWDYSLGTVSALWHTWQPYRRFCCHGSVHGVIEGCVELFSQGRVTGGVDTVETRTVVRPGG